MNINKLVAEVHENAKAHGWWDKEPTFGDLIALCHTELSEAMEEHRNGRRETEKYHTCKSFEDADCDGDCRQCKYYKPEGIPYELADVVIRVMDTCGHYGIDLEAAILEKHAYNKTRPYKHGGKLL